MNYVFIGYDHRQPLAFNVAAHSIARYAKTPTAVIALNAEALPITRFGVTQFTFSRFLVPWLCKYRDDAIFVDSDVVVTRDITELFDICRAQPNVDICVNKDQKRFEWASVMYFNNQRCSILSPEYVNDKNNNPLALEWPDAIGDIPQTWNHCAGYVDESDINDVPGLIHHTEGIPQWPETRGATKFDSIWFRERARLNYTVSWMALMQKTVHARQSMLRFLKTRGMV